MDPQEQVESQEVLEPNARNIILAIISQLTKGADLHRVSLPTFVLEPRSFLERITDFMSHPEQLLEAHKLETPQERIKAIAHYYLSGWHIRPKGVRKPYNPVLGEYFRCRWEYANGTKGYYISEQISHHPPVSAYVFVSPENNFLIQGEMKPKSKFYGTSAGTSLEGSAKIKLLNHPGEEYVITYPNIIVYGILFGKLTYELSDTAHIRCEKNHLVCKAEFKTKGVFSGSYHALSAKIKDTASGEVINDIQGKWTESLNLCDKNGGSSLFFDVASSKAFPKIIEPEPNQGKFESRRLWQKVTENLASDLNKANEEKLRIEQEQRDRNKAEEEAGIVFTPKFFDVTEQGATWKLKSFSTDPQKANEEIEAFIFANHDQS